MPSLSLFPATREIITYVYCSPSLPSYGDPSKLAYGYTIRLRTTFTAQGIVCVRSRVKVRRSLIARRAVAAPHFPHFFWSARLCTRVVARSPPSPQGHSPSHRSLLPLLLLYCLLRRRERERDPFSHVSLPIPLLRSLALQARRRRQRRGWGKKARMGGESGSFPLYDGALCPTNDLT